MRSRWITDGAKRHGFALLNAALAVLGAAFLLAYVHPFGVRLTPDTANYIAAAESVVAGEGFRDIHDQPLGAFPPLFPLVVGIASLGILDPRDLVGPLNALFVGLTAFVVGQYLRDRLESRFLAAWGCLMAAMAWPHFLRTYLANTEPLFVLLSVLALICADRFLTKGGTRMLLWTAVLTALACLTRYIGVSLLAPIGLALLFAHPPGNRGSAAQMAGRLAVFVLIAAAPVGLWFLRNLLVIGSFTRHAAPRGDPVSMLPDIWDTMLRWIDVTYVWAFLIVLVLAATRWKRIAGADLRPAWLFGSYSLVYAVSLMTILLFVVHIADGIGHRRQWMPMCLPLMIAALCVLDRVFAAERHPLPGTIGRLPILRRAIPGIRGSVLIALAVILLSLDGAATVRQNADTLIRAYRGHLPLLYNSPRFHESETLRYIRQTPGVVGTIYSNEPYAIFLHADKDGLRPVYFPRERSRLAAKFVYAPASSFLILLYGRDVNGFAASDYGLDLRTLPGLNLVAEFEDGIVYKVVRDE